MPLNPKASLDIRSQIEKLWATASIPADKKSVVDYVAANIMAKKGVYEAVGRLADVPWYVVGCFHYRESNFDFGTWLANGDPLFDSAGRPVATVHEPRGLGPAANWMSAAVMSLENAGLDTEDFSNTIQTLINIEGYNGFGYAMRGVPSPYLWSMTNQYTSGKYVSDGVYDPNLVDQQVGCAALLLSLNANYKVEL